MPLHTNRDIGHESRLLIWEIEESPEWFLEALHLDEDELLQYNGFRTDQRRVHWLAYRHLLKNVLGKGKQIRVKYDPHSKPFIDLSDEHISVSHSGKFAAVITSKSSKVGIDIEQIHPRLHRVAGKFLSPEEGNAEDTELSTEHLCLHWCAKEAIYKLHGERELDFLKHIRILKPEENPNGLLAGRIIQNGSLQECELRAEKIEDYYLVIAMNSIGS
jgi:phosphopantetheine--protein transferase-like protein